MDERTACHRCQSETGSVRYAEGDSPLCSSCYDRLSAPPRLKTWEALLRTLVLGGLSGTLLALGAAVLIVLTGRDFALYWILVGGLMAKACNVGSERRSGRGFRMLAMGLLYCSIGTSWLFCFAYWALAGFPTEKGATSKMPMAQMLQLPAATPTPAATSTPTVTPTPAATPAPTEAPSRKKAALGVVLLALLPSLVIVASPLLVMYTSPISILIYGLAMSQVWKGTAPDVGVLSGPIES